MAEFKFKVGDILCHRVHVDLFDGIPVALFVVERRSQECPGETQLHYLCRLAGAQMLSAECESFNESELAEYPRERLKSVRTDQDLMRKILDELKKPAT